MGIRTALLLFALLALSQVVQCIISVRSVPEGEVVGLSGSSSLGPTATYLWDLDADGLFGEIGASALHGDEIGRTVRFQTIGRDGSRLSYGFYPVFLRVSNGGTQTFQASVEVVNARPTITSTGGPYTTKGPSVTLTASGADPGGLPVTILWDLDLDGVFGEVGNAAQNGDEVGPTVRYVTEVNERDRSAIVRVRSSDGALLSDIASTRVTIPGLASTRRCSCSTAPVGQCASVLLTDTASFSNKPGSSILTRRASGARVGGVFRSKPIVFDTSLYDGFEFCGKFQVLAYDRQPPTHVNDANDGGLSFVITSQLPASSPSSSGFRVGVINRPKSAGVALRFITATDVIAQVVNTYGFPNTNAGKVANFPPTDKHQHTFNVQYQSGIQLVRVFIDGILVLEQNFNLLDEGLHGPGPIFRIYPGFAASVSSAFSQDISVGTNFFFCTRSSLSVQPPTCASECTPTQTTMGCNVPVQSPTACNGVSCSNNNIPNPVCINGQCAGTCSSSFADCNGDKSIDGCETNIGNDPFNCGGCGISCPQINGGATCVNGVCQLACATGFANCNLDQTDGCETNVTSSLSNCGSCGRSCLVLGLSSPTCTAGNCVGACVTGFADCNMSPADGCETPVSSNPDRCGSCTTVCSSTNVATRVCTATRCTPACQPGFADCNSGVANDGCESDVSSSTSNCGGCGVVCSTNNINPTCAVGQCQGLCINGFLDCNGDKQVDGCETNPSTSPTNCGGCGLTCSSNNMASVSCSGGNCVGTCNMGWSNCDNDLRSNGCETSTSSDLLNCGMCGNACTQRPRLSVPQCVNSACGGTCDPGWLACPAANKASSGCTSQIGFSYASAAIPPTRAYYTPGTPTAITFTSGLATVTFPFSSWPLFTGTVDTSNFRVSNTGGLFFQTTTPPNEFVCASGFGATFITPVVAPFLGPSATTYTATHETLGTTPNRRFVVHWTLAGTIDFTVTFEESTYAIEFGYNIQTASATTGNAQYIGLTDRRYAEVLYSSCVSRALFQTTGQKYIRYEPSSSLALSELHPVITATTPSVSGTGGTTNPIMFSPMEDRVVFTLQGTFITPGGLPYNSIVICRKGLVVLNANSINGITCSLPAAVTSDAPFPLINTVGAEAVFAAWSTTDYPSVEVVQTASAFTVEWYTPLPLSTRTTHLQVVVDSASPRTVSIRRAAPVTGSRSVVGIQSFYSTSVSYTGGSPGAGNNRYVGASPGCQA